MRYLKAQSAHFSVGDDMETVAAILEKTGQPLVLAELKIPKLKTGQVLVKVVFSGVCHTQVLECRGYRGADRYLPHCLGHEGSGIVQDVGPGVAKVKSGDRVVLSWIKGTGSDAGGTVYKWVDRKVNAGPVTTFSRYSIVSENRLTVIPGDIPMREAALLGCAIPTGVGAVLNTARPRPGQSIAVFGTGGVGLCAVAGAVLAGCVPVIAVDVKPDKLLLAKQMGATYCINAGEADPLEEINGVCPDGLDFAIEASGRTEVMKHAFQSVRSQGGVAVIIGNARHGERLEIDPRQFNLGKRLFGTWGGDCRPERDFPNYCKLLGSGKLSIQSLLSDVYPLDQINKAIDDLEAGKVVRPLIDMEGF